MASVTDTKLIPQQTTTSRRGCPVCGGGDCEVLHTQRFVLAEGHPLSTGYDVAACAACGFVYADTQVSQKDYDDFYARFSKYEDSGTSTGGGGSPEDAQRLKEMAASIAEAIPNRDARLLDIGCAGGGLLKELRDLGYTRLCGIDPSPACVQRTKDVCDAEGFAGSLSLLPADAGQFDGVFLSHVFEHVQDLSEAVQNVGRLTLPGGVVYVEVPDASRYVECLLAPFQDFNTEHINHFSARSLENLFSFHGWVRMGGGSKTLLAAPGMPYPAVFAFFTKSTGGNVWKQDAQLRNQIVEYIRVSREMMQQIDQQIAKVLATNDEVMVWGTGQLAMKLLGETCLGRAKITAFVDGNPINQGKVLQGSPILAPSGVNSSTLPIIVTSIIHKQAIASLIQERLGLANPVILLGI